jgi:dihydrofolate reductase
MATGKLTLTTFLTLDGVMQAPGAPEEDPSGGFPHGGWAFPFFNDEAGRIIVDRFGTADAFLLGRKTWQIFAAHWPRVTDPADPIASALNRLPKYVASRTLERADWQKSTIIRDVPGEVARLKQQYSRDVQVHGSGDLAQTLFAHDLVDECDLLLFPIVLGSGKRLFGPGSVPAALKLVRSQATSNGVVVNTYRRAGKPTYGSFALDPA